MEISFHTDELLNLCFDESIAVQKLGNVAAEALRNRLDDIRAADAVHELLAGHPHTVRLGNQECYRLEIEDGTWLAYVRRSVVVPNLL